MGNAHAVCPGLNELANMTHVSRDMLSWSDILLLIRFRLSVPKIWPLGSVPGASLPSPSYRRALSVERSHACSGNLMRAAFFFFPALCSCNL